MNASQGRALRCKIALVPISTLYSATCLRLVITTSFSSAPNVTPMMSLFSQHPTH